MRHTKVKGEKMKIEILLKEIRMKKRIQFRKVIEINRHIKVASKLYREKRERTYSKCSDKNMSSFKRRYK